MRMLIKVLKQSAVLLKTKYLSIVNNFKAVTFSTETFSTETVLARKNNIAVLQKAPFTC